MDVGRRPYRTKVRPWRDSQEEVTIHWYQVPKQNGTLPYPSRINSLAWRDLGLNPSPVGEVPLADVEFDGWNRIVAPLPKDHICGTREDFVLGGLKNTSAPPLIRGNDGIPTCCRAEIKGVDLGGVGLVASPAEDSAASVELGGHGLTTRSSHSYILTVFPPPPIPGILESELPLSDSFLWLDPSNPDVRLTNTQPRGTTGNWRLEYAPGPSVWDATWNGLGSQSFAWVSGPFTDPREVSLLT